MYRAFEGEKPVLTGGKTISDFSPYQGKILKADVAAQGFKGIYFRQLILRRPAAAPGALSELRSAEPLRRRLGLRRRQAVPMYQRRRPARDNRTLRSTARQDARRWSRPEEGEVFVFPRYNWWNNIVRIASVDRGKRGDHAGRPTPPIAIRPGDRYYVQNLFEELDAPGEWYLDRQHVDALFLAAGAAGGQAGVRARPCGRSSRSAPAHRYITLRGFTIECCEGHGRRAQRHCEHCLIAGNTIRNVGDYHGCGVAVDGGTHNGVVGNDISEIGSHGIRSRRRRPHTLTAGRQLRRQQLHPPRRRVLQAGRGHRCSTACGNRASHNLIHDGPRMGIMFSGNNLLIEYNHIRHMNLETEDTGAVYTGGRDWISSRGTVIRYNYFHDMLGYGQDATAAGSRRYFAWGVYLDDNTGGVDVIGNIVVRCPRAGIHLHNGRDNLVENNIFVDGRCSRSNTAAGPTRRRIWTRPFAHDDQGLRIGGTTSRPGRTCATWTCTRSRPCCPTARS